MHFLLSCGPSTTLFVPFGPSLLMFRPMLDLFMLSFALPLLVGAVVAGFYENVVLATRLLALSFYRAAGLVFVAVARWSSGDAALHPPIRLLAAFAGAAGFFAAAFFFFFYFFWHCGRRHVLSGGCGFPPSSHETFFPYSDHSGFSE